MNVIVSIPVRRGGFTGQRDQWEESTRDHKVYFDDGKIMLESSDYGKRYVQFDLDDLLKAVEFIKTQEAE